MTLSKEVIGCLSLVERRDGRFRVSGVSNAYKTAGKDPRNHMADSRIDDRDFGNELYRVCRRLVELAET